MIIRRLVTEDYDELIALWQEAGLSYRPNGRDCRDKIAHEIAGTTSIFLVAESEERIIGAILGTHDGRKGWINRLAVVP
ncbi:GNAT family N-acetyltransferase, partial [Candidatus Bipolaricaulota bacterium]|nr:GNAT family N-acetyltransferase [Candidatus Bipolaricaulota bacterium]